MKSSGRTTMHGFTLVELMVVISIAAIALSFAVPAIGEALRRSQVTGYASSLMSAINRTKAEAQRPGASNVPHTLCGSSSAATPATAACDGMWRDGAIVFADINGNGSREAAETVVFSIGAAPAGVTVVYTATLSYVLFAPNGLLHGSEAGGRFTVSHSSFQGEQNNRHVCVMRGGVDGMSNQVLTTDARFAACEAL